MKLISKVRRKRDPLGRARRSRAATVGSLLVLPFAASSCDGCLTDIVVGVGESTKVEGAVLNGPRSGTAGDTVTFDATGSKLGTGGACPEVVYFYADDADGADATIESPKTTKVGEDCVLADGAVKIKLPAGTSPGVRDQTVLVSVQTAAGKGSFAHSSAEMVVKIDTPAPVTTPPTATVAASASPPATDHGDGGGHGPGDGHDDDHGDGGTAPAPGTPVPDFSVSPLLPVAGEPVELDARTSTDEDGTIVAFRWDLDGDGSYDDDTGSRASFTPGAAGALDIGLEVEDDAGNKAYGSFRDLEVLPAGSLAARAPSQAPPSAQAGARVWFYAQDIPDVDQVWFDADGDQQYDTPGSDDARKPHASGSPTYFETTFATPGLHRVHLLYVDADSGRSSRWTAHVEVAPDGERRVVTARAAVASRKGKAERGRAIRTTATMSLTSTLVAMGDLAFRGGDLTTTGAIVRGTIKGKVPAAAARRAPAGLKSLYSSRYAGRFDGRGITLGPTSWTIAGRGTVLARSRKDARTMVCLGVTTDGGATPDGSRWKVLGATGRAARFQGTGAFQPLVIGGAPRPAAPGALSVRSGKRKGLPSSCRALVKHLRPAGKPRRGKRR